MGSVSGEAAENGLGFIGGQGSEREQSNPEQGNEINQPPPVTVPTKPTSKTKRMSGNHLPLLFWQGVPEPRHQE